MLLFACWLPQAKREYQAEERRGDRKAGNAGDVFRASLTFFRPYGNFTNGSGVDARGYDKGSRLR